MSPNPYENEPGFENAKSREDEKNIIHYAAKVVLQSSSSTLLDSTKPALD